MAGNSRPFRQPIKNLALLGRECHGDCGSLLHCLSQRFFKAAIIGVILFGASDGLP
jgi:hypothetical protein